MAFPYNFEIFFHPHDVETVRSFINHVEGQTMGALVMTAVNFYVEAKGEKPINLNECTVTDNPVIISRDSEEKYRVDFEFRNDAVQRVLEITQLPNGSHNLSIFLASLNFYMQHRARMQPQPGREKMASASTLFPKSFVPQPPHVGG